MDLSEVFARGSIGINEIRLGNLLEIRECIQGDAFIKTLFPPVELGSITLVDQIVLLSLMQIVNPKKIVEIGTHLGYSAAILAMNTHNTKIFSIDLPSDLSVDDIKYDKNKIHTNDVDNDNFLRVKQHIEGEKYLSQLSEKDSSKIELVKADSTKINFQKSFGKVEMVFIDGGHEMHLVEQDTMNARSIISKGVLIWHDYGSEIHVDVTAFLKKETTRKIFHVRGSLCAFELIGF